MTKDSIAETIVGCWDDPKHSADHLFSDFEAEKKQYCIDFLAWVNENFTLIKSEKYVDYGLKQQEDNYILIPPEQLYVQFIKSNE